MDEGNKSLMSDTLNGSSSILTHSEETADDVIEKTSHLMYSLRFCCFILTLQAVAGTLCPGMSV